MPAAWTASDAPWKAVAIVSRSRTSSPISRMVAEKPPHPNRLASALRFAPQFEAAESERLRQCGNGDRKASVRFHCGVH